MLKIMRFLLVLLALPAFSQINIAAGVQGDPGVGGYPWSSPAISSMAPPFNNMRAGASFSYDLNVPVGTCTASLQFIEPRPSGPDLANQSSVGSRLFTVSINGSAPVTVDIFASAGALKPLVQPMPSVPSPQGHLTIQLVAQRGNAILSGIIANCVPTPPTPSLPISIGPDGTIVITGNLYVTGGISAGINATNAVWRCNGPTGPTSDCTGLYFIQLAMQDGTILKVIGAPPSDPAFAITPQWMPVPLPGAQTQ